ncbi:DUF2501 domain-containing protein [Pigmentiphaga aceris]|uniref:DUF2501 domain-containing protein n=1 Tax=Pigmentiphaga aceris TaxID=1940612 RepID=A0A5C0AVK4_9BURK|nr:DUF2501 domain-containing protein [Pigmentiphaga aceris]QEI04691.1 DUF2501 domain-containing protein [Pigmentiphaga aceris]
MKTLRALFVLAGALTLQSLPMASHAQLLDAVKGALGNHNATSGSAPASSSSSSSGGLGALSGLGDQLSLPAIGSASAGNVAGVLTFCMKNNYLGSNGVAGIKDKLLGKLGGQKQAAADPGYADGMKGIIGGGGSKLDLSNMRKQVTDKACEKVLEYGKSML